MSEQHISTLVHDPHGLKGDIVNRPSEIPLRPVPRGYSGGPGPADGLITPHFVLRALRQWWHIATPIGVLLAAGASAVVLLLFTPVYRASAVLQIASHAPYIAYRAEESPEKSKEFVETQIEMLQSPLVLEPVLSRPEIADLPEIKAQVNPIEWLSQQVKVKQVGHSELYDVYLDAPDAEHAALLVNAVTDSYFNERKKENVLRSERVIELLAQEREGRAESVQRLREKMRSLSKDLVGKDPFTDRTSPETSGRYHPRDALQERLTTVEVDRKLLEVEVQAMQESIARDETVSVPTVEVESAVGNSDEIRELRALLAHKKVMLHRVEVVAAQGKEDVSYRRLEREVKSLEKSLDDAAQRARPQIAQQLQSTAALERKDALGKLEAKLASQRVLEAMLRDRYKQQVEEAGKSGDKSLELEFTRAELAREEKVFEMISERGIALTTEMRAPGRVTLLRDAQPPSFPVERLPLRNLALAILASGCLPFALALLWERSARRIVDADQLAQQSSLAVVGEIAHIPPRLWFGGLRGSGAVNLFEESIDSLRTCVVLAENHQGVRVLAVTSAVHGEGKTSVASQLAISIARSTEEPTLLIDGDLRAPSIHRVFGVSVEPGLADVLAGRCPLDDALVTNCSQHVHLLPAGVLAGSPHKLLGSVAFAQELHELRSRYRYIVIDTPPILSAAEALLIAKLADGTLICTRRNFSRERQVRLAYERLLSAGARPLGAVFNAVPTSQYVSTYGTYSCRR